MVHQELDRDKYVIKVEGVPLGHPQIAGRHVVGKFRLAQDPRRCRLAATAGGQDSADADPNDGAGLAGARQHDIAYREALDRQLSRRRQDRCTRTKAESRLTIEIQVDSLARSGVEDLESPLKQVLEDIPAPRNLSGGTQHKAEPITNLSGQSGGRRSRVGAVL